MASSYMYLNGLRTHYLQWNRDGDPTLILLHGLASNARIWELVSPYLVGAGFRVLAPDARGHGRSDKPAADYSFEAVTGDLCTFIEAANLERFLLVGHSWGASVALDYAARIPYGPRAPLGIILVDGGMVQMDDQPGASWQSTKQRLTPPRLIGTPIEEFTANLEKWNREWLPEGEAREQIISIIMGNFDIDERENIKPQLSYEHHMQIVRAMWDFPLYRLYSQVHCPALMVPASPKQPASEREEAFLAAKKRGIHKAQQTINDLTIYWMENSIHDIPLQIPHRLADLITEFVARIT